MDELKISIVDYGLGNLRSVVRAFKKIGREAMITANVKEIAESDCVIIPGVGAFEDGMNKLKEKELDAAIIEFAKTNKPILGICLGMQLLMSESEEFGLHKGLNLIEGKVIGLKPSKNVEEDGYKVPNFGWCDISPVETDWKGTILDHIDKGSEFYFVHSFYAKPKNNKEALAITNYGDQQICAVIKKDNIMGCQFHPEKSGEKGLQILRDFCRLVEDNK